MPKKPTASPDSLKRERAGTYRTPDGRFTVEQSSSGWLVLDAEQSDELGLPLARGPFPTLDGARSAIPEARSGPVPTPRPIRASHGSRPTHLQALPSVSPAPRAEARKPVRRAPPSPVKPAVVIRELRAVDGDALRAMWTAEGFKLLGDDDLGLARLARRNPGLVLVAAEGTRVVGSAFGTWDGRRGWIYLVTVQTSHRRQGIANRMIDQIEEGLRALGCPMVHVMVGTDGGGGPEFWAARGFAPGRSTQFSKVIREG